MSRAKNLAPGRQRWLLLLWSAALGLLFGILGLGEIAEDWLRVARNKFHMHEASGQIVLIRIDDQALREFGNWPWPRSRDAELVNRLDSSGAKQIVFDINFAYETKPGEDEAFAAALRHSGRVVLLDRVMTGPDGQVRQITDRPLQTFERNASVGVASVRYNYQNAVWDLPYAVNFQGRVLPSFAAVMANHPERRIGTFPLDYSIAIASIPSYSAADVLSGKLGPRQLAGKTVIVGIASEILGDTFYLPGYGLGYGMQVHAIGAETLITGTPRNLGWLPGLLIALLIVAGALRSDRDKWRFLALSGGMAAFVLVPIALETRLIFADITPGLFVLMLVAGTLGYRRLRARGLVNGVSGLPNLAALTIFRPGRKKAIVAARMLNYEDALATLPSGHERQLVDQIVSRLTVGAPERRIFQGDGGIFAWFAEPREPFGNHLEALHSLFRNPARVDSLSVDLAVTFGVELGSGRSLANRLASALVAAEDAARDGLKWKCHDPETLQNASWRLSMLSQLDEAIDKGEVWVAYQPKLELKTRRIVGCEALARWTHPQKGPIAASEFVAAAEQHNRIGKLTDFVLEQAIANASPLVDRAGGTFDMAVNMSASILTDKHFALRLSALLARHGLEPRHLTLELTETAALASSGDGLEMIGRLRDLGVGIAIDDYGTGLSTLDYLKRVPANEIKIDQSFIKGIADNRSDRLMVQSTIELAHSLGLRVVAEGVELREIVDLLAELKCDIAQGFAIGRPMSLESLTKRIVTDRKRSAA